jgi:hypothetical protein
MMSCRIYRFLGDLGDAFATAGPALLCAFMVACDSCASVEAQVTPTVQPTRVAANRLGEFESRPPSDEPPITPMETVGASPRD